MLIRISEKVPSTLRKNVIFDPHIYKDWLFYVSYTIEYHITMPWVVYKSANVASRTVKNILMKAY